MKWYDSPSSYMNSMLCSSRAARSTRSSEENRCSIMFPLRRLRILAWTKPRRLPGVRWNTLKTENSSLLNLTTIPGRIWVEEIIAGNAP